MQKLAKIISRVFGPFIEAPIIIWLSLQLTETSLPKINLFLISFFFVFVLPFLFFFFSLKKNWITDWDISKRQERYSLYIFTTFCLIGLLTVFFGFKEIALLNIYLEILIPLLIFFAVTFFYKISGHAFINSLFMVLLYLYLPNFYVLVLGVFIIAIVGWSRIVLKKHTFFQIILGALLPLILLI